jgi:hypothetical protein
MGRVWAELTTAVNSTPRLRYPKCEQLPGYKTKVPRSSSAALSVTGNDKMPYFTLLSAGMGFQLT